MHSDTNRKGVCKAHKTDKMYVFEYRDGQYIIESIKISMNRETFLERFKIVYPGVDNG